MTSWLQSRGIEKGDRVAIMLPNVMAYPAILYGVLNAGATVVNINPLYTPRELIQQMQRFRRAPALRAGEFRRDGRGGLADLKIEQSSS